jgi:nicotinate-nucleotide adenylyltransferase
VGHLWLAETAVHHLHLDRVVFMPVGHPPHKKEIRLTSNEHRLNMTLLAIEDNERFAVDDLDISRDPPHYTLTLLQILAMRHPKSKLWWLIGSDSLRDLPTWHAPDEIVHLARLGVLSRPNVTIDWVTLWQEVSNLDKAVTFLPGPTIALSATNIRQRVAAGRSVRYLVPQPVINYITKEGLYSGNSEQ